MMWLKTLLSIYLLQELAMAEKILLTMDQCPQLSNSLVKFENISIDQVKDEVFQITGNIVFYGVLDGKLELVLRLYKCESMNKCRPMVSFETKDFCKGLKQKNDKDVAITYAEFIGFEHNCPYKEGKIPINATMDMKYVKPMIMGAKRWQADMVAKRTDNGTTVVCQMVEILIQSGNRYQIPG